MRIGNFLSIFTGPRGFTMRLRNVVFMLNTPLGSKEGPTWSHGPERDPQNWPRWKFFKFAYTKLDVHRPSSGHRLWLYTRRWAYDFDIYIDRRHLEALR